MNPSRRTGAAAALAAADARAGVMASITGSAIAAPRPRRTARRGIDRLVMIMTSALLSGCSSPKWNPRKRLADYHGPAEAGPHTRDVRRVRIRDVLSVRL